MRRWSPAEPLEALSTGTLPSADTLAEPTIVEVMFLYTPQTVIGAGSVAKIQRQVTESVEEMNYRLTNSRVNVQIRPIFIGEIAYTESGDIVTDLQRLAGYEGAFARAGVLRTDYKADIVCLVTELENQGIGGYAWDIPPLRGNAATAFTAVRRQALGRSMVLAHEMGHLFGCAHDREHAGDLNDPWFDQRRPYFFGYRLVVEGVTYVDVMGYDPGISLPYYSNPRQDLDGVPLGIPEGTAGASDISRTINETAPYVAAYRTAQSRVEFTAANYRADETAPSAKLHLKRTGNLSTAVRVSLTIDASSTAREGIDYLRPAIMTVQFQANQAEATFEIPLVKDATPEPTRTIRLSLGAPSPSTHGIGWQGETVVYIDDAPPIVAFSGEPVVVQETNGVVEIQADSVEMTGAAAIAPPVTVWRLEGGSAVAGKDFVAATGQLTYTVEGIPAGQRFVAAPIRIALLEDSEPEPDKTLRLVFEGATNLAGGTPIIYGPVTNEIRIVDNDRLGSILRVPGAGLNPEAGLNLAVRHDGKMMVWGGFDKLRGIERTGIALLNADGTVDENFKPPVLRAGHRQIERLPRAGVQTVKFLADGKMLLAGFFARVNGQARTTLVRLNPNGTLDETFGAGLNFDGEVADIAVQPDGKYVVGGSFEKINGERRAFVARLHSDGTVDDTFKPNGGAASSWTVIILAVTLQPDGKILIGGYLEQYDGATALNVARLNSDGALDTAFKLKSASGPVSRIELQADGKIMLAGLFDTLGARNSRKLGRVLADGSNDTTFRAPQPNAEVREVICLPDGRLLVTGAFTRIANADRRFIALLNADGSLNTQFDLGAGPDEMMGAGSLVAHAASIHANGTLYLSGRFESISGLAAKSIAAMKIGPSGSAITRTWLTPAGELSLRGRMFPGPHKIEGTTTFNEWAEASQFVAEGFGTEGETKLPVMAGHRFFRFKSMSE